jgi:flagellar hook assembly protein FlgD
LSAQGDLLDEMVYSESMHTTSQKDKCGISLEKKSPELLSSDSLSWASASFLSGYGTPGRSNRCAEQSTNKVNAAFWLERKSFSPSDSENNKLQIRYSLASDGFVANIRIFEASGREVCSLAENSQLSAEGTIEWNGKEQNDSACRVGLYVTYIEIHNTTGQMRKYKLPFALVR